VALFYQEPAAKFQRRVAPGSECPNPSGVTPAHGHSRLCCPPGHYSCRRGSGTQRGGGSGRPSAAARSEPHDPAGWQKGQHGGPAGAPRPRALLAVGALHVAPLHLDGVLVLPGAQGGAVHVSCLPTHRAECGSRDGQSLAFRPTPPSDCGRHRHVRGPRRFLLHLPHPHSVPHSGVLRPPRGVPRHRRPLPGLRGPPSPRRAPRPGVRRQGVVSIPVPFSVTRGHEGVFF
jgi:hypothetical protein